MMESLENSKMLDGSEWQEQTQSEEPNGDVAADLPGKEYFKITLSDPKKVGDGSSAYISYAITTTSSLPEFICTDVLVRRRFQDFAALHRNLSDAHPASVMPPAPGKHRMEYITGDRFSTEFIERRRQALQSYLGRIARHFLIQKSPVLHKFLSSKDAVELRSNLQRQRSNSNNSRVFEAFSDVFINAFSKIKDVDPKFVAFKEHIDQFEESLQSVEKQHRKMLKLQTHLEANLSEFSNSVIGLGEMETDIKQNLIDFGTTVRSSSVALKEKLTKEEGEYMNFLEDYINYCHQVKDVLKLRDQKQLDVEELNQYLKNHIADRDRTMSTSKGAGALGFIQDRVHQMKGIDAEVARQHRLEKLEAKIVELREAQATSVETCEKFSKQVEKEIQIFNDETARNFNSVFESRVASEVEYHEKSLKFWDELIKTFEL